MQMFKQTLFVMAMVSVMGGRSQAALLAGTSTNAPVTGQLAVGDYGLGADYPVLQAKPFSTGGEALLLESISFGSHLQWASGGGNLYVSLFSDSGSLPGAAVPGGQNLFSASSSTVGQILLPTAILTLQANSTYWFVLGADQSGGATRYWWNETHSGLFDSDFAGTDMPLGRANDALGSWTEYGGATTHMQINGSAVPEPATISLFGLGGFGTYLIRCKRRRRLARAKHRNTFEEIRYTIPFMDEERGAAPLDSISM